MVIVPALARGGFALADYRSGTESAFTFTTSAFCESAYGSPKPSAERTRRAGAAWAVDQVYEDGQVECSAAHGGAHGCAHVLARAHPRARQALRRRLSSPPRPVRGPLNEGTVTSPVTDFPSPQE